MHHKQQKKGQNFGFNRPLSDELRFATCYTSLTLMSTLHQSFIICQLMYHWLCIRQLPIRRNWAKPPKTGSQNRPKPPKTAQNRQILICRWSVCALSTMRVVRADVLQPRRLLHRRPRAHVLLQPQTHRRLKGTGMEKQHLPQLPERPKQENKAEESWERQRSVQEAQAHAIESRPQLTKSAAVWPPHPKRAFGGVLTYDTSMIHHYGIDECSVSEASIPMDICNVDIISIVYRSLRHAVLYIVPTVFSKLDSIWWCIDVCIDVWYVNDISLWYWRM